MDAVLEVARWASPSSGSGVIRRSYPFAAERGRHVLTLTDIERNIDWRQTLHMETPSVPSRRLGPDQDAKSMKEDLLVTLRQFLEDLQREHYKECLPSFSADAGEVPAPSLVTSISSRHHHLLREIGAGFGPANSINASACLLPGNAQIIVLDFGIVPFLASLNKILLSRADILGFEPTMEFDLAASRAISVVKSFFGDEDFPRVSTSPRRTSIASSLSNLQTSFVMGHELSHLLLGALQSYDTPPSYPFGSS